MNLNTRRLHDLGQSLWLDNITREILANGTLGRYISDLSVTGLTSNPTIFEHAIGTGGAYDEAIGRLARQGVSGEDLFFALALEDLRQAADLFRPAFDASDGVGRAADDRPQPGGNLAQQHVADGVAERFVDMPEMIEIEYQHGDGRARARAGCDRLV